VGGEDDVEEEPSIAVPEVPKFSCQECPGFLGLKQETWELSQQKFGDYGVFFKVLYGFMGRLWKFVVMNEGLTNKNDALICFNGIYW
jgi:hypothetical protein